MLANMRPVDIINGRRLALDFSPSPPRLLTVSDILWLDRPVYIVLVHHSTTLHFLIMVSDLTISAKTDAQFSSRIYAAMRKCRLVSAACSRCLTLHRGRS